MTCKKHYFFLILFILSGFSLKAQNMINISGALKDTVSYSHLGLSGISAIRSSDSILIQFTRADDDGNFKLAVPANENYILMFTHPLMATLNKSVEVKNKDVDLGDVVLSSKTYILEEVLVIGTRAITIKGDTTEYAADSFQVSQYANVDELLKKLPGLEVDDKGNITAHGEKVQRMLVDGDEFFSDDPAVLSKMLRASAVNKVQVFDGKTEDAEFTGVDDGIRIKTINLQLKDDAKRGYFGKVELGGGLPGYWENQAMINFFKDKRKISVFGIMSNTNKVGLGWDESSKFGGRDNSFRMSDDGGFTFTTTTESGDDFDAMGGSFSGQGLPKTINGGAHYGDKFGENNQHELTADYRINSNSVSVINNGRDQYVLPDTQYVNVTKNENFKSALNQRVNTRGQIFIDSTADVVIRLSGTHSKGVNESDRSSYYADMNENKLNESNTRQLANTNRWFGDADINFRKKFKKQGRTMISTFYASQNSNQSESSFNSLNDFFGTGDQLEYNQMKRDTMRSGSLRFRVSYTEPLSDKIFLVTNAYTNYEGSTSARMTYDQTATGDSLNTLFSSNFDYKIWTYSAGASLRFDLDKYLLTIGGNFAYTDFMRKDLFGKLPMTPRKYPNFFPNVTFRKSRSQTGNFSVSYNGATNQPTIDQLQPMTTNQDPLNIVLGNPDLEQEFRHNINLTYGKYELLKEQYFYVGGNGSVTTNAISSEQNITDQGVRTYRAVNVPYNYNAFLYGGLYKKIKAINSRMGVNVNTGYFSTQTIINGENTFTTNASVGLGLSLDYDRDSTMNFSLNLNPDYNNNSTNTSTFKTDFFSLRSKVSYRYTFAKGFELGTNLDWYIREKTSPQDINNNVFLWNAYVSQSFLKDRSLVLKVAGNDILNQNVGYSRYTYNNIVSENTYNNIQRYFMLSLTWNFTHSSALNSEYRDPNEVEHADTDPDAYKEEELK